MESLTKQGGVRVNLVQGYFQVTSGSATKGDYSLKPTANSAFDVTSLYGATDMVYAMHACGLLESMGAEERATWAATISSFQNASTGWPLLKPFEAQHCANPPYANHTWHAAGAMLETLALLSSSGPPSSRAKGRFHPLVPFRSVSAMLARGPAEWESFLRRWLSNYADVWMGSQAVQSLVAVVKLSEAEPKGKADAFYSWLFSYLNATSMPATGMWDGQPLQDDMHLLGGAFHIFHVYQCFDGALWPHAAASVDTALAIQDNESGVWGGKHRWADREHRHAAIHHGFEIGGVCILAGWLSPLRASRSVLGRAQSFRGGRPRARARSCRRACLLLGLVVPRWVPGDICHSVKGYG